MSTVRVGVAIRRPALEVRFSQPVTVHPGGGHPPLTLQPGVYRYVVDSPTDPPRWGARVATYVNPDLARATADYLTKHGLSPRILEQGEQLRWGDAGRFDTRVHAVVLSDSDSADLVLDEARQQLWRVPPDPTGEIPGARRFEDELPRVEPVRLAPPQGGMIRLSTVEGDASFELPSPLHHEIDGHGFELANVTIGIDFHWQRDETLAFRGDLDVVADGNAVTAVNEVDLDDYLASLLGSEMRPDWPQEALKAQAVAARSTVLATRYRHHGGEAFHLCHDDHCQCYQGVSRESDTAREALAAVRGQILVHDGRVADARYAKTSGVLTDGYEIAWDDEVLAYLVPVSCGPSDPAAMDEIGDLLNRDGGANLHRWLRDPPEWTACNPHSHPYPDSARDMEGMFRWQFELSWEQLTVLVRMRTQLDLGPIRRLEPLQRGISGRIIYLRVHGEGGTVTVGKELAIRRLLSESHLPSSAFEVRETREGVTLDGLGWGHGVGLCQLGAAGLANDGWDADRLLTLFYPGAESVRDQRNGGRE